MIKNLTRNRMKFTPGKNGLRFDPQVSRKFYSASFTPSTNRLKFPTSQFGMKPFVFIKDFAKKSHKIYDKIKTWKNMTYSCPTNCKSVISQWQTTIDTPGILMKVFWPCFPLQPVLAHGHLGDSLLFLSSPFRAP